MRFSEIERIVARFEGAAEQIEALRSLLAARPERLEAFPVNERVRAQLVCGEALYRVGDTDAALEWLTPALSDAANLWRGYALFDRGGFGAAASCFEIALTLSLQPWARVKLEELLLCCRVYEDPGRAPISDLDELYRAREPLSEEERPLLIELSRLLADARSTLPPGFVERAEQRFRDELISERELRGDPQ